MTTAATPGRELLALADKLRGAIDFSDKFNGLAKMDVALLNETERALRLAAKPADEGVRDAISKAYFIQRTYDKNSGAHIISFGFNLKEDALVLENLSTTEEPKR